MGACFCKYSHSNDYININNIRGSTKITIDGISYTSNTIKTLYNSDGNISADGKVIIHTDSSSKFNVNIVGSTGDISGTSGKINVNGPVKGHIKATSGNITISGDVAKNVNTTSGNVYVSGGTIKGTVGTSSGDVIVKC